MAAPRPLRVLVADDLLDARDSLRALVELWEHEVHTVENGRAAVEIVLNHCCDAVILDLHMPVMDGMMAAEIIGRQEGRRAEAGARRGCLTAAAQVSGGDDGEDAVIARAGWQMIGLIQTRACGLRSALPCNVQGRA
jgi:CheY-like chemotaxis protein